MGSKKLLEEDQVKMYNKWVRGIATREQKPTHVTVGDLLQASGRNDNNKAPLQLPFPLTHIIEDMGTLYLATDNIQSKADMAKNNPVVTESDNAKQSLDGFIKKCLKIKNIIESMTNDLDIIVDRKPYESRSSEPEDNSEDVPSAPMGTGGSQAINKLPK
tara:strand:- start:7295 stop:7774 length:480 start_codon:yes stop_codon:yes gene_type:complete